MIGRLEGILKNELCTAVHICNSCTQEVKMRGLVVLGQLRLHKRQCLNTHGNKFRGRKTVRGSMPSLSVFELQASQNYMKPDFKISNKTKQKHSKPSNKAQHNTYQQIEVPVMSSGL